MEAKWDDRKSPYTRYITVIWYDSQDVLHSKPLPEILQEAATKVDFMPNSRKDWE